MVLDHYDGMTFVDETVNHVGESGNVLLVKADCRLFQKIDISINRP